MVPCGWRMRSYENSTSSAVNGVPSWKRTLRRRLKRHCVGEITRALKEAAVRSPGLEFDFADVKVPNTAFRRVVRDLEFDVAEIAIVTYLMAKAHGKPLRLLPAVLFGRFQHPYLVSTKDLRPKDLEGKKVAIRSRPLPPVPPLPPPPTAP